MRNPTRKQQLENKNAQEAREKELAVQLILDENDARKIEDILGALLDLDTNKAREIIKSTALRYLIQPRQTDSTDNHNSLKCPLALHAVALALATSNENITTILNEMSDSAVTSLKECIAIAQKTHCPNKDFIAELIADYKNKLKNQLSENERVDIRRKLKSVTVTANVIDLWDDAVNELSKWASAVDSFIYTHKSRMNTSDTKPESGKIIPDEILSMRIDNDYLPIRAVNSLKATGIESISDLVQLSKSDLRKIHGLGPKGYHDVLSMLKKLGLDVDAQPLNAPLQSVAKKQKIIDLITHDNLALNIRKTNLSKRAKNCLMGNGIDTIGKLIKKTKEDLNKIHGFGHHSMNEIECLLENMGLTLANPTPAQTKPDLSKIQIANLRSLKGAKNPLLAAGIDTVDKLIQMTEQDLRKIHGLGLVAIQHIDFTLKELGLELPKAAPVTKERHERKTMLDVKALESQLAALVELYKNAETDMANAKLRRLAIQAQIGEQTDDDEKIEQLSTQLQTEIAAIKKSAAKMESLHPAKELSDKLTAAKNAKNNAQKALNAAESTLKSVNAEIAALLAHDWQI